jgi:hypothetical protein
MPILGILASQISGRLSSYESIATVTVGVGGQSSVTFSSIPSTYKHLQIRYIAKNTGTVTAYSIFNFTFNGDSAANYSAHQLYGNGSSAGAGATTSTTSQLAPWIPYASYTNVFGAGVIDILDYANTSKYKTTRILGGFDSNGDGVVGLISGLWQSTAAVSSISFTFSNFAQYSQFALYGVKG